MLKVRCVTDKDCRLLWEWVNDPAARAAAFESAPIVWEAHATWFKRERRDPSCFLYIVEDENSRPVGQVRFESQGLGGAEIDLSIGAAQRGHGYGVQALHLAREALFAATALNVIVAHVRPENGASVRTFERAGFAHEGMEWIKGVNTVRMTYRRPSPNGGQPDRARRPIRVIITGAGGGGTVEIIRALKPMERYEIIALDASRYAAGFDFADRGYVVPRATDPTFTSALRRILETERPQAIVPLVDEEIVIVHRLVDELSGARPIVVAPTASFCEATLDKWVTFERLARAEISTPSTWLASETEACIFPAVIKPRYGHGSRGVAYLAGPTELATYLNRADGSADEYVIQQRVIGQEYTVSCVVALGGPTLAVVPKEVIMKRGITQQAVTRVVPAIDQLCRDIQERLRADGPFNVQLIMTVSGVPSVIEINPRYSTTVALTIAAGVNEVDLVIRHALDGSVEPAVFQPNLLMVRYPTQLYRSEAAWPPSHVSAAVDDNPASSTIAERGQHSVSV